MKKILTSAALAGAVLTGGVMAAPAQAAPVYPSSSGSPTLEEFNLISDAINRALPALVERNAQKVGL